VFLFFGSTKADDSNEIESIDDSESE